MVAQQVLVLFVQVRILVVQQNQPTKASRENLLGLFLFQLARKRCIRMYETDTTTFNLSIYNYANRQYYKAICMRYSDIVTHKVFYYIKQLTLWKKQYLCVAFKTSLNLYIDSCI